ncbi:MAG: aldehyde dehydrogenase family protein [Cyclobacteriaceae bacterium]
MILANSPETQFETIPAGMIARSSSLRMEHWKQRKKRLDLILEYIFAYRASLQKALAADMNKSPQETDILEIYPVITEFKEARKKLRDWSTPDSYHSSLTFLGSSASIQYEPKGVVLIIAPWNYPFNLTIGPMISAIAAGNCIVLKPSEFTPATSSFIKKMCESLFDKDMVQVLEGDGALSAHLTSLPFDHIFFTGSPQIGKLVMQAAAKNLTSVTLELGGKSPTIVDETADIKDAAKKIAWAKWINAGQTCVAPDYLFVHESKRDELIRSIGRYAEKIYGEEKNYTSIINEHHFSRLSGAIEDGLHNGGEIAYGGKLDRLSCRIFPTLFTGLSEESTLMKEEIFGPILPIIAYQNLSEVIAQINGRPKALSLYIFSKSKKNQARVLKETSSGTAVINDAVLQFGHPSLPFGGVNNSGIGKAHGRHGFIAFSNEKSILKQRVGITMAQTLYPPFTGFKNWMLNILLRYF